MLQLLIWRTVDDTPQQLQLRTMQLWLPALRASEAGKQDRNLNAVALADGARQLSIDY
jgi:hypothetical protein